MNPFWTIPRLLTMLMLFAPHGASAQGTVEGHAADDARVKRVIAQYAAAWNASDMQAWGALFVDNVDYVNRGGGWWRSNDENVAGHARLHERLREEDVRMDMQLAVSEISYLSRDAVLVHVSSHWPGIAAARQGASDRGMMTVVMVKSGGAWRIRALQNTVKSRPQQ